MRRYTWVKIDLNRLRQNLSSVEGRDYSVAGAEDWLRDNGFMPAHGGWVVATETDLALLGPGEMLDARPATSAEITTSRDADAAFVAAKNDETLTETSGTAIPAEAFGTGTSTGSLLDIPTALIGSHRDVMRRWRPVARRAAKDGNWDTALSGLEMRPVHEATEEFVLRGPDPFLSADHILLYPVLELLMDVCRHNDRDAFYGAQRNLIVKGLDHFWFCLASQAHESFLISTAHSDADRPVLARIGLPKILRWWDVFCDLGDRYYNILEGSVRWSSLGNKALAFCDYLGMSDRQIKSLCAMGARAAGQEMADWFDALNLG